MSNEQIEELFNSRKSLMNTLLMYLTFEVNFNNNKFFVKDFMLNNKFLFGIILFLLVGK